MTKINETGFWEGLETSSQHCYDKNLSGELQLWFLEK